VEVSVANMQGLRKPEELKKRVQLLHWNWPRAGRERINKARCKTFEISLAIML
jgi:hypothetical protein